ncbi:Universal stress protein [Deinococcus saxicola]|uniref:hypothetical protein n=1 Tax=Deinococcus saxicola TaxID=249406 RepID=UPI0039EFF400
MTQLTFFGPEAATFIPSLAYRLTCLDHRVTVLYVGPDHTHVPIHAAHLAGIRLGELYVRPQHFGQAVDAVRSAGFGHALVIWCGPAPLPAQLASARQSIHTERLDLQELVAKLAQKIEQARLAGTGPLALTITDVVSIH